MPAIKRYTGAWYGVIKKLEREGKFPSNLDILIVSAKYGLIPSSEPIENYDWEMTVSRARELNRPVLGKLKQILEKTEYKSILINMGKSYEEAIRGFENIVPTSAITSVLSGAVGSRKKGLREWILSRR